MTSLSFRDFVLLSSLAILSLSRASLAQKLLLPVFDYVHKSGLLKKQDLPKMFVSHKELVNILESGTPEQFRNGMRSHLENHFKRLFDLT